jgi:hypothetical protein
MSTTTHRSLFAFLCLTVLAGALTLGCDPAEREDSAPKDKTADKGKHAESKKTALGKNVYLEILPDKKRRVLVEGTICLREGQLELFLCRKHTKEHEAIIAADVDARNIHLALNAAGAVEGSPVRFVPKYRPASGTTIKVSVQYKDKDKLVTVPAREWIKNDKTKKLLESDWVFGGSHLVDNPLDPGKKHYLANDGDVICVSNFETAMLDLPIKSPKDDAERFFVANTEKIPPLQTKVLVILEPVLPAKKDAQDKK